jgi:hypothetical protein
MNFKLGTGFHLNKNVTGECYWNDDIYYGKLSILAFDFENVEAGYYISNKNQSPFAYRVKPETINIVGN